MARFLFIVQDGRKTEIDDLNRSVLSFVQVEEILGFEITVTNVVLVAISNCLHYLLEDHPGFYFCKHLLFDDDVEEFASLAEFHDQV